jgi:hypothetical protein
LALLKNGVTSTSLSSADSAGNFHEAGELKLYPKVFKFPFPKNSSFFPLKNALLKRKKFGENVGI